MARESLDNLITEIRKLISDPAGAEERFSDDDIQVALDARRRDVVRQELRPQTTIVEGGTTSYLTYWAGGGWWESDVHLQDSAYKTLTDLTSPVAIDTPDYAVGSWLLSASLLPPVYLTGKQYDLYNTAADLLEQTLAEIREDFDYLALGRTFKRSQSFEMTEKLIKRYRSRGWIGSSEMVRTDQLPGIGWNMWPTYE